MIDKAYIQAGLGKEESLCAEFLSAQGILYDIISENQIEKIVISQDTLPIGSVSFMAAALRKLGIKLPKPNSYPVSLQSYLHRQIWQSTLGAIRHLIWNGHDSGIFIFFEREYSSQKAARLVMR